MKLWSLLIWVTQFGVSAVFPVCAFLLLGTWLQNRFGLGVWVIVLCGVLGLLTSARTVSVCLKALRKEAEGTPSEKDSTTAFNDHV